MPGVVSFVPVSVFPEAPSILQITASRLANFETASRSLEINSFVSSFIDAKMTEGKVTGANVSVRIDDEFMRWGFVLTEDKPEYVVLGFDKTLTYQKLVISCDFLRKGVPFVATHPDINCPMENTYIPDTGAMIELIKASTGVSPKVIGKPNKEIIESAFKKFGNKFTKGEFAMVGDRLYTDVATGKNAGICSILVLSGESTLEDAEKSLVKPTVIAQNVGEIMDVLKVIDSQK